MTKNQRKKCNNLARLFYKSIGYEVDVDFDFSQSAHPQELTMWNQALLAHDVLLGTDLMWDNWVDVRKRPNERYGK